MGERASSRPRFSRAGLTASLRAHPPSINRKEPLTRLTRAPATKERSYS